jgi:hypothetical protein
MFYDKLKLYQPIVNVVKFPKDQNEVYEIIFLGENIHFKDAYHQLNIDKLYAKCLLLPRYKDKKLKILNREKDALEYKKELGLYLATIKPDKIKKLNLNFFFEITPVIDKLVDFYDNFKSPILYKFLLHFFNIYNQEFPNTKKVLLYTIDTSEKFSKSIFHRKIYLLIFLLFLHKKGKIEKLPFDDLLLCYIDEGNPQYRLLVKDGSYNLPKIVSIFKQFKPTNIDYNELTDEVAGYIVDNIEDKLDDDIKKNKSQLKSAIKTYLLNSKDYNIEELQEKIVNKELLQSPEEKLEEELKAITAKAIVYSSTGNIDKTREVDYEIKTSSNEVRQNAILNSTIDKFDDLMLSGKPKHIAIPTINDPLVKSQDPQTVLENKLPKKIIEKRQKDFEETFIKDVENIFKILETKDVPLKIEKIEKIDDEPIEGELEPTHLTYLKIVTKDPDTGETFDNVIKLPRVYDGKYLIINGKRKVLLNQLMLIPIVFIKPYQARVQTNYATISIAQIDYKQIPIFESYIGGLKVNLPFPLFAYFGLDATMKLMKIKYEIKEDKDLSKEQKAKAIKIHTNKYILYYDIKYPWQEIFINSIKLQKIKSFPENFKDSDYYKKLLQIITGNRNSPFIVSQIFENIIDPISLEILKAKALPTDIRQIIIYIIQKLPTGYFSSSNNLNNIYIRTTEIVTNMILKQVMSTYNHYRAQKLVGGAGDFKLQSDKIFSMLLTENVIYNAEYINPVEELTTFLRTNYSGYANPPKDAIQLDKRSVDDSYFGQIDPVATPEGGSIGVLNHLTVNAEILNTRGLFGVKQLDNKEKHGILTATTILTPFVETDEPTRVIMVNAQAQQVVPLNNTQIPAVMTGYEAMLPSLSSDIFIKKSPCDGKVLGIKDGKIQIQCNLRKEIKEIDVSEYQKLKSGAGISVYSDYNVIVKKGEKVKKDQILATGKGFKDGVLSMGTNLLQAFMTYKGYTFEDGIVISESVAKSGKLDTDHIFEVETIIKSVDKIHEFFDLIGQQTEPGQIIMKYTPGEMSKVYDKIEENDEFDYFDGNVVIRSPGGKLQEIFIAPNESPLMHQSIYKIYQAQKKKAKIGSWKIRGERIDGIYIKFVFVKTMKISVGDKLTNRHGAKGTVSYIEKDEFMPVTPWGEKIDIITNPIGVIDRINLGQLYEMYMGMISRKLAQMIIKNGIQKWKQNIELIKRVYLLLDNTDSKKISKQVVNYFNKMTDKEYLKLHKLIEDNKYVSIMIPPFQAPSKQQIFNTLRFLELDFGYELKLPEFNTYTKDKVPVGIVYIYKLEHIANKKIKSKSSTTYKQKTGQPIHTSEDSAQKSGEFDSWALLSWDAESVIKELYAVMSDDIITKKKMIQNIIKTGSTNLEISDLSPTKNLVANYLKIVGVNFD